MSTSLHAIQMPDEPSPQPHAPDSGEVVHVQGLIDPPKEDTHAHAFPPRGDAASAPGEEPTPGASRLRKPRPVELLPHGTPSKSTPVYSFEKIPAALRHLKQWFCWRLVERDGKKTKMPFTTTGQPASSTDPATWSTFEEAVAAYERGGYDGIGFVFTEDDPFCGIDLDHIRDLQTGETAEWAEELVKRLDSYTEESQSGEGLHIIVRAELPGTRRRKRNCEIYNKKRYFCMTGHHLPDTPATVEERQTVVNEIYAEIFGVEDTAPASEGETPRIPMPDPGPISAADQDLIGRASKAKNGAKFAALWRGDWQGEDYTSQSDADAALLAMLRFWTSGDKARAFALFSRSGLSREKWTQREDYREGTWALASKGEVYSPRNLSVPGPRSAASTASGGVTGGGQVEKPVCFLPVPVNAATWLEEEPAPIRQLVKDIIDAGTKNQIVGPPKGHKSTLLLSLALSMAAGRKFLAWDVPEPVRVLLIQFEIYTPHFHRRLRRMAEAMGITVADLGDRLLIVNGRKWTPDRSTGSFVEIEKFASDHRADIVLLDPFYKLVIGNENDARDIKPILAAFDHLAEMGAAVVWVDHTAKGEAGDRAAIDRAVGSGVKARDFDSQISSTPHRNHDETRPLLVLEVTTRNYPPTRRISVALEGDIFTEVAVAPVVRTSSTAPRSGGVRMTDEEIVAEARQWGPLPTRTFDEKLRDLLGSRDAAKDRRAGLVHEGLLRKSRASGQNGATLISASDHDFRAGLRSEETSSPPHPPRRDDERRAAPKGSGVRRSSFANDFRDTASERLPAPGSRPPAPMVEGLI